MNHAKPLIKSNGSKKQHMVILDYLQENPSITNEVVQELLSIKKTRAYKIIRDRVDDGQIVKRNGDNDNSEYVLP